MTDHPDDPGHAPAAQRPVSGAPIDRLAERVRAALPAADVRERRMFGTRCFMVDGRLAVAAQKDGGLLVHVDPETDAAHLREPHATRAEMGAGRSMGPGWIRVEPAGIADDAALRAWIDAALRPPAGAR